LYEDIEFKEFKLGQIPGKVPEISSKKDLRPDIGKHQGVIMRRAVGNRNIQAYAADYTSNTTDELDS
jgi:hypothetical protein